MKRYVFHWEVGFDCRIELTGRNHINMTAFMSYNLIHGNRGKRLAGIADRVVNLALLKHLFKSTNLAANLGHVVDYQRRAVFLG